MAVGGYKLVSFSWTGGRSDSNLDRAKFVLHGLCSAIVGANVGWSWDTDFNDGTIDSCQPMGASTISTSSPNIAYFLKHVENAGEANEHTYRICVGYNFQNSITNFRDQDCVPFIISGTTLYNFYGGLYVGMMKDGSFVSDSTYGYIPGSSGQFLRWMHFSFNTNSNERYSLASQNSSGVTYTYFAYIKGAQLGFFLKSSGWSISATSGIKGFLCGEIFTTLAHASDSNTFAAIYLQGGNNTGECMYSDSEYNTLSQSRRNVNNGIQFYNTVSANVNNQCSQIFSAADTLLEGNNTGTKEHVQIAYDTMQVDNNVCSTTASPGGRWTPCFAFYSTQDQDTYGVVTGDSFKGFLDTDLIRGVNPQTPFGQVLGSNSEFYHIGGGFAIGWDASNTVFLF